MRRYETIVIIRPNAGEAELTGITDKITGIIENSGGSIVRIDNWGLKKLAYLIKQEQQGHYIYIEYAGMPAAVSEIERILRIDDLALKYLTVKTQETYVEDEPAPAETVEEQTEEPAETAEVEE